MTGSRCASWRPWCGCLRRWRGCAALRRLSLHTSVRYVQRLICDTYFTWQPKALPVNFLVTSPQHKFGQAHSSLALQALLRRHAVGHTMVQTSRLLPMLGLPVQGQSLCEAQLQGAPQQHACCRRGDS